MLKVLQVEEKGYRSESWIYIKKSIKEGIIEDKIFFVFSIDLKNYCLNKYVAMYWMIIQY